MPGLRWLVTSLSLRRPGFPPGSVSVGFVVDKVALRQVLPCQYYSTMVFDAHISPGGPLVVVQRRRLVGIKKQ
jgi:hypothetical protein